MAEALFSVGEIARQAGVEGWRAQYKLRVSGIQPSAYHGKAKIYAPATAGLIIQELRREAASRAVEEASASKFANALAAVMATGMSRALEGSKFAGALDDSFAPGPGIGGAVAQAAGGRGSLARIGIRDKFSGPPTEEDLELASSRGGD